MSRTRPAGLTGQSLERPPAVYGEVGGQGPGSFEIAGCRQFLVPLPSSAWARDQQSGKITGTSIKSVGPGYEWYDSGQHRVPLGGGACYRRVERLSRRRDLGLHAIGGVACEL